MVCLAYCIKLLITTDNWYDTLIRHRLLKVWSYDEPKPDKLLCNVGVYIELTIIDISDDFYSIEFYWYELATCDPFAKRDILER